MFLKTHIFALDNSTYRIDYFNKTCGQSILPEIQDNIWWLSWEV